LIPDVGFSSALELVGKAEALDAYASSGNSAAHNNNETIISTKLFIDNK